MSTKEKKPSMSTDSSGKFVSSDKDLQRYRENLREEINGAALYRALADLEKNPKLEEVYRRLASVEDRHADVWARRLKDAGLDVPAYGVSWRTKTLIWLARRFGVRSVLPTVLSMEESDSRSYALEHDPAIGKIRSDEFTHARLIRAISQSGQGGMEGGAMARMEGRHRVGTGNALRAAVLGANDGLVSNLSLVMGVAGASLSEATILITGLAGLLAGAISMGLGEWLSVKSSQELYEHQIQTERMEIEMSPEEEAAELALIYQAKGLSEEHAQTLANKIMSDETTALETMAREELGIDPQQLGGSAKEAAVTSFFLFAAGAVIPVLPFFFLKGSFAILAAFGSSLAGLFAIGAGTSLFTGRTVLFSGLRQVSFGAAAATITYLIGRLLGVSLS